MDAAVGFGLLAALCWGCSDFAAKITSDRIGALRTALFLQYVGSFCLLVIFARELPRLWLFPTEAWFALLLGVLNATATFSLFKGFEVGKLSIVSPVASSYPALTSLLALVLLNETISQTRLLGILAVLLGVVLVSLQRTQAGELKGYGVAAGVGYAVIAFFSLGFMFFGLKLVVGDLGAFLPVLLLRLTSSLVLTVVLLVTRSKQAHSLNRCILLLVCAIGIVDTIGNSAYNLGIISGAVSVVSVLGGLFSAVTVLLAFLILRDRLTAHQGLGLLIILVGVAVIGYST